MLNKGHTPARSVDLITAAIYEVFLHVGGPALAEVVYVVVFMAVLMAVVGVVDGTHLSSGSYREFKNGEEYHAAQFFNRDST
jgi:hypothetical protein